MLLMSVNCKWNMYHSLFLLLFFSLSLKEKLHIVGFASNAQWLVDHKADMYCCNCANLK